MATTNPVKPGSPLLAKDENEQRSMLEGLIRSVDPARIVPRQGNNRRFGIIKGSTATGVQDTDSNDIQWTYTMSEVYKSAVGYGDGTVADIFTTLNSGTGNGYGWIEDSGIAYNFAELGNSTAGVQGNGIDIDNASYSDTSFQFIACPDDTIVEFVEFLVDNSDGAQTREAWFYWHTPVDGEC